MSDRIAQSLSRLFEERRVIFWYDPAREMRGDYEAVSLTGVGASANGRILWKLPDGHTYAEWEAGQEGPHQAAT